MTDTVDLAMASRLAWRREAEQAIELLRRWMDDNATLDEQARVVDDTRAFLERHTDEPAEVTIRRQRGEDWR